jgi:hypothetical protein
MGSDDEMIFIRNNMQVIMEINTIMGGMMSIIAIDTRQVKNDREFSGYEWIQSILQGHPDRCHDSFRMNVIIFLILCDKILEKRIVQTNEVTVEERVGMFLQILGHSTTMRKVGEDFQRSLETIHRCFKNI